MFSSPWFFSEWKMNPYDDILDNLTSIDFNCTSFNDMCIFNKNRPNVLHKSLGTDYRWLIVIQRCISLQNRSIYVWRFSEISISWNIWT